MVSGLATHWGGFIQLLSWMGRRKTGRLCFLSADSILLIDPNNFVSDDQSDTGMAQMYTLLSVQNGKI